MTERTFFAAAAGFEAARETAPEAGQARSLHGHSFLATIRVEGGNGWAPFPGDEVRALHERLDAAVRPLDYALLNRDDLPEPTDESLARWVRGALGVEAVHRIGIQSTARGGVDIDHEERTRVWRRFGFNAAHQLPNVPYGHKCGVMHGHRFDVILHARRTTNAGGAGLERRLDELWAPIAAELDHACLNDIRGLENPTSELIASWIWQRLESRLAELSCVTVYETASCGAHFDGNRYRIWKDMSLDSAVRLKAAPQGDPRRRLHGHTYLLRLGLAAPLDAVMGWTIDFGDVKALFTPVFKELDHKPLHEIVDLEDTDAASIARLIRARAEPILPALDCIELYETRGCGAILSAKDGGPVLPA